MTQSSWKNFVKTKNVFLKYTEELSLSLPNLRSIQQKFADSRSEASYTVETPVVYNSALDKISINDEIKLILVADNPGRREQAAENRRYLVGPSGKIADKFFRETPSLGIDFYKNVIILNKTPIHSPRTIELRELCRIENNKKIPHKGDKGDQIESIQKALNESQVVMASLLNDFYKALNCPVWITGYSEMKKGGIFEIYTEELKKLCTKNIEFNNNLFLYRHFSMNQFTIDLKKQALQGETASKTLKRIGKAYREKFLKN
ncbi:MAG: hypothetical protein FWD28_07685 [Treponema sp.]|nr:hypothetical protein [Treponema sp.]